MFKCSDVCTKRNFSRDWIENEWKLMVASWQCWQNRSWASKMPRGDDFKWSISKQNHSFFVNVPFCTLFVNNVICAHLDWYTNKKTWGSKEPQMKPINNTPWQLPANRNPPISWKGKKKENHGRSQKSTWEFFWKIRENQEKSETFELSILTVLLDQGMSILFDLLSFLCAFYVFHFRNGQIWRFSPPLFFSFSQWKVQIPGSGNWLLLRWVFLLCGLCPPPWDHFRGFP